MPTIKKENKLDEELTSKELKNRLAAILAAAFPICDEIRSYHCLGIRFMSDLIEVRLLSKGESVNHLVLTDLSSNEALALMKEFESFKQMLASRS